MHGLILLILVFAIAEELGFVNPSKLVSKEDLEKVDQAFQRDIIDINGTENESGRQRRYFIQDFFWEDDNSFSPRLVSINAFRLMLVAVVALVILN